MAVDELLNRARGQMALGIHYRLGGGKLFPEDDTCAGDDGTCDCSGFVDWCFGLPRQFDHPFYNDINGGWINTDAIWRDAKDGHVLFIKCAPAVGGLLVYPSGKMTGKASPTVGHVGIVTAMQGTRVSRVLHCSESNMKVDGQAIHETDPGVFESHETTICCRCYRIKHDHETCSW